MKTKTLLKKTLSLVTALTLLVFFGIPPEVLAVDKKNDPKLKKATDNGWYWFRGKSYEDMLGELKDGRIMAEEFLEFAKSGKKPNIISGLVALERARLKGLDKFTPYEEEGILYKGPDFSITEKTEKEAGLKVRTVSLINESGEVLKEERMVSDEVIVGLNSYEDALALTSKSGLNIGQAPPSGEGAYRMKIEDEKRVEEAIALLETEGNATIKEMSLSEGGVISFAEPNGIVGVESERQSLPNDPEFWSQWALHNVGQDLPVADERFDVPKGTPDVDIDAPEAWDIYKGEKNITIAIIDTGCDYNHPDLYDNIWRNPDEVPNNNYDDDGNGYIDDTMGWNFAYSDNDPMDDHNHGTHLAGIIASSGDNARGITGVMHKANLMIVKVLNDKANGTWYDASRGIRYAINKGAKVINISWSGNEESQVIREALLEAKKKGVIIVCSSGSEGKDIDLNPVYPASYPFENIITVCAIDAQDRLAPFTNTGAHNVDLAAPGVQILSINGNWEEEGEEDYIWGEWGTSASAAYVTGSAGLLYSLAPAATQEEIRDAILSATFNTPPLKDKCVTSGRLNLYDALNLVTEGTKIYIDNVEVDGDGIISPGEIVSLSITLKNIGDEDGLAITGTLFTDKEGILIRGADKTYGDIPSGLTVTRTYTLEIDQRFVTPDLATFTMDIRNTDADSSTRRFMLPLYTLSSISGKVLDYTTKSPLEDATVNYEVTYDYEGPSFGEVKTNSTGSYALPDLKDGKYRIKASYTGMVDSDWYELTLPPSYDKLDFLMGTGAKIEYEPGSFEVTVPAGMKLNKTLNIKNVAAPDLTYFISSREKTKASPEEYREGYRIVKKIPAPAQGDIFGICWDGEYLWVAMVNEAPKIKFIHAGEPGNYIYKIDPKDGKVLKRFFLKEAEGDKYVYLQGLEWVDGKLWYFLRESPGTLNCIDPNFTGLSGNAEVENDQNQPFIARLKNLFSEFLYETGLSDLPPPIVNPPIEKTIEVPYVMAAAKGICWDGEKFWVSDSPERPGRFWHVDPNKNYETEEPPYIFSDWCDVFIDENDPWRGFKWPIESCWDLAWDGRYLWTTKYLKDRQSQRENIFNCDPSTFDGTHGSPERHFGVRGPSHAHMGITFDGEMMWVASVGDEGRWFYQLDIASLGWIIPEPDKGRVQPDSEENIKLTFDSMNFKPFTDHEAYLKILTNDKDNPTVTIPVTMHVSGGPGIKYLSHIIDDDKQGNSWGDGDTYLETGETVEMKLTLVNEGTFSGDARDVTATLSTNDEYITIFDNYGEFGDIPGNGGKAASKDCYLFKISDTTPQGHKAKLILSISDIDGHSWEDEIFITVRQASYVSGRVSDAKTGLPVTGARVIAEGAGITREAFTDAEGIYKVYGLYDGAYSVQVYHDNYLASEPQRVMTPPSTYDLDFALKRPAIGVEPNELIKDVAKGGKARDTLVISNTGTANLTYNITENPTFGGGGGIASSVAEFIQSESKGLPPRNDTALTNGELVAQILALKDRSRKGINPELAEKIQEDPDGRFNVIVEMMADEPEDLAEMADRGDKEGIIRALQARAESTQLNLVSALSSLRDEGGITYKSFWVANVIAVQNATKPLIEELARREDVREVREDAVITMEPPFETTGQPAVGDLEWNIERVKADKCWEAGIDGTGLLIGSLDTGVDPTHPDLQGKIRAENGWFDAVYGEPLPYDDHGHGTHTIGTMVGGNRDGTHIGVAPMATYISAKAFTAGGSAADSWLLACGEWLADPDNNPETDDAPSVICNSWGDSVGTWIGFWDVVTTWVSLNIFPAFANGNGGPLPRTVGAPACYPHAFGVGATTPSDEVWLNSSRGPSLFDNIIKPDISAPGTEIKSSYPGGEYKEWQGTSMACPHVAATVALMKQVNPYLTVDKIRQRLEEAAKDLGEPGKDNTYGAGLLNSFEAIKKAGVHWIQVDSYEGVVRSGETKEVNVLYDTLDLEKGAYECKLSVQSNDPVQSKIEVPVTMNVVSGPSIAYESHTLEDTPGLAPANDGDGSPEPGETVRMKLTLKNIGEDSADTTGVAAWLSTPDTYINIADDYGEYGDMLQAASAISQDYYEFGISAETPEEYTAVFNLRIQDGQGKEWRGSFSIVIRNTSKVQGRVIDVKTTQGLKGAVIRTKGPSYETEVATDDNGDYTVSLYDGVYSISCAHPEYLWPESKLIQVPPSHTGVDFELGRPEAVISPDYLSATVPQGGKAYRKVKIRNEGSVELEFLLQELVKENGVSGGGLARFEATALSDKELVRSRINIKDRSKIGITPPLYEKMEKAEKGRMIRAIVEFADIADIEKYVGNTSGLIKELKRFTKEDQKDVVVFLKGLQKEGLIGKFKTYWISNIIALEAPADILKELEKFEGIREIRPDEVIQLSEPEEVKALQTEDEYEWNVSKVRVPEVWAHNIDGTGILVGSIDTGVEADHPDLVGKIRLENNFFDPYNGATKPYDDYGHGTHTMGTTLGGKMSGKWIGIVPGATYIMAKGFDSSGAGYTSELHQCFEWILDPDGNPDTNDYPDVCNNSWGGGGASKEFWDDVTTWIVAGIFPAFAIGNSGDAAGSTGYPGNYPHSFGVGATDSNDEIAPFSSRGPVEYDDVTYIKPDISAPGIAINSAFLGKTYKVWQGTSMACPHITGVVALMRQSNPMMPIDAIRKAIEGTAVDLGETGKDNAYGAGRLDAYEAFLKAGVAWLYETPAFGIIGIGEEKEALITFDASRQAQGEYEVDLIVYTNDPVNPSKTIPVTMTVGTGPSIIYESHEIDDDKENKIRGDGDGFTEPGETIHMKVTLANAGKASADTTGVTATLSVNDDYIGLIDDYEEYGDMLSGVSKTSPDSFKFTVAETAPDNHVVKFTLTITDANNNTWEEVFYETIIYGSTISGNVTDRKTGEAIQSATVKAEGPAYKEALMDLNGNYEIAGLLSGEYRVSVEKTNYDPSEVRVVFLPPDITGIDFELDRPLLVVAPDVLSVKIPKDAKADRYITIKNDGTSDLEYHIGHARKKDPTTSYLTNGELVEAMLAMKDRTRIGLDPELAEKLTQEPDGIFNVMVEMVEETEGLPEMADRGDKEGIIRALQKTATSSQADVKTMLNTTVQSDTSITYRSFWITNVISIRNAPKGLIGEIAEREDVRRVSETGVIQLEPPIETNAQPPVGDFEWNIERVKVDKCHDIGIDGTGVLIGSIDTGVDATHPDLAGKMRPENGWFDPVYGEAEPTDVHGHGTHTIGTMVGGDADGTYIGVAPGATFIAANGFAYDGPGYDDDLIACGQWMMDPDGNPSTDDAPCVVSNSWGCPNGVDRFYWNTVTAWVSAGIFPSFAAGNSGYYNRILTIWSPAGYPHAFAVGATMPDDERALFSSIGPSDLDYSVKKPDIVAPGTEVKSSFPGGGYKEWQGTSMACPHVSATVALMKQMDPYLTSVDEFRGILEETAKDLGEEGKDNYYGAGLLNSYEAVRRCDFTWLSETPREGVAIPEKEDEILVTFDPSSLDYGKYYAEIIVTSNDPLNRTDRVAVELEVADAVEDTTPPWGSVTIENGTEFHNSSDVTLSLTAEDDTSGQGDIMTRLSIDGGSTYGAWEAFSAVKTITLPSGEGTRTVHVRFKDGAGNESVTYYDGIVIDTTNPTGSIIVEGGREYTVNTRLLLELAAEDNLSGVESMAFSEDGTNFGPEMEYSRLVEYACLTGDGRKTIHARIKDRAGNTMVVFDDIIIDTTGPEITITSPSNNSTLDDPTPLLDYTISDNFDTDAGTYYVMVDGLVVAKRSGDELDHLEDGSHTLKIASKDHMDNIGYATSEFIINTGIDTTPPTGSITIEGGAEYATLPSVELSLAASDDMTSEDKLRMTFSNDGVSFNTWEEFYAKKQYILPESDGTKTVYVKFKDAVGNESADYSDSIILDTTVPQVTITSPLEGEYYEDTTPLLEYAVDDPGASVTVKVDGNVVTKQSGQELDALPEGYHTVSISAEDAAGNMGSSNVTFRIDLGVPIIKIISPADGRYYNDTTPVLEYALDDPHATVTLVKLNDEPIGTRAGEELPLLLEGEHRIFVEATDEFARSSSAASVFTIDLVAPALSIISPLDGSFINNAVPLLDYDIDDVDVMVFVKLDGEWLDARKGQNLPELFDRDHIVEVRAIDKAGNIAIATSEFTVDTVEPLVTIALPGDGSVMGDRTPFLSYIVEDEYPATVIVRLNGEIVEIENNTEFATLAYGDYVLTVEAQDPAKNTGSDASAFTISSANGVIEEIQITDDPAGQGAPDIYGNRIVWTDSRNGLTDIYMYDLKEGLETPICTDEGYQNNPVIFEDRIAYVDNYLNIYTFDVSKNEKKFRHATPVQLYLPAIYQDRIVWHDSRNWPGPSPKIYMYTLPASEEGPGEEMPICAFESGQTNPAIYGDRIIWADTRDTVTWKEKDIYMYDLSTDTETRITATPLSADSSGNIGLAMYENKIVYANLRDYNWDIYMCTYDPATDTGEEVHIGSGQSGPHIHKDKIVYEDYRSGNLDIYLYDLTTEQEISVTTDLANQRNPRVFDDKIVWEDYRNNETAETDIYMALLYYVPEIASITPAEVAIGEEITISGDKFASLKRASYVQFTSETGGVLAKEYASWSNTEVVCRVPSGAATGPVKVVNLAGESNGFDIVITEGFFIPQNLTATTVNCARINLTWDESSDPESGIDHYNIYRDGVKIGESTTTSYKDKALDASTIYTYEVSAVNGASFESDRSASASSVTAREGDVNGDNVVNIRDLVIVARAFGSTPDDSAWDERADMAPAWDKIDIRDLIIVARHFGEVG